MIVARLSGRLGNQLFQYATGRALALRLGVPFALDTRYYTGRHAEEFALDAFRPRTVPADDRLPDGRGLAAWFRGRLQPSRFSVYRERSMAFDPAILALPDGTYLDGYFQDERYFADAADPLRDELTVRSSPSPENAEAAHAIGGCCAVSLHIRRGDYVTNRKARERIGVLDLDYYRRAAAYVAQAAVATPTFFIFSDEPDWAEANLRLPHPVAIVRQRGPAVEDLRLMAACRHHIIANSSFSWWGAWLNPSPDKIVVAPSPWYRSAGFGGADPVPASWRRLAATHV